MSGQIAVFEGYRMPRKRRKRTMKGGSQRSKFAKAARACSRRRGGRKGSFQACMKRLLKKGRRSRRRR